MRVSTPKFQLILALDLVIYMILLPYLSIWGTGYYLESLNWPLIEIYVTNNLNSIIIALFKLFVTYISIKVQLRGGGRVIFFRKSDFDLTPNH